MTTSDDTTEDRNNLTGAVSSASLVLAGSLFGAASKLLEQVIIARLLSENAYGQVAIGISAMSLGLTLGLVGCNEGIPRFMARFEDTRDVRGVWLTGLVISGIATFIITTSLLFRVEWVINTILDGTAPRRLVVLFVLAIPFLVGLRLGVSAIQGFENTIYRTYSRDLLYNGLRLGLLVVLLLAGVGIYAAGYAYIVAAAVGFIVVHLFLRRLLPLWGEFKFRPRQLALFSLPLSFSAGVTKLLSEIDTIMLAAFIDSTKVGVYNNAYLLATGLGVIFSAFGFIYLPLSSRLDSSGDHQEINRVHKLTAKWTVLAGFPVFLTFVAFPTDIIGAVFGERYVQPGAGIALAVLSCGFFASGMAGYCQSALSGFGYTRSILVVNVIAAVANTVLNFVLIPIYGIVGAAVASALSFATLNWVAFLFLYHVKRISPFSRFTVKMYVILPVVLFPPTLVLSRIISLTIFTIPVFVVAVGLVSVVLCAVTGCFQAEDEIPVELIENSLGINIPLIRRYIPES